MRRAGFLVLIVSVAIAACGGTADEAETPSVCLGGVGFYFHAVSEGSLDPSYRTDADPANTRISDCLVRNQSVGNLTTVGATLVKAATKLNAAARRNPGGYAVQLGFLVGAVTRGAEGTGGIHTELQRRVEAAALYSPGGKPPPEPFDQRYKTGYAAGKQRG